MKQQWTTAAVIPETENAVTIIFDTGGAVFQYEPGQFINLSLVIEGKTITRSYSLSSSPDEDERPAITVKRVPGGVMSGYILKHAEAIREWEIEGPLGLFYPDDSALKADHMVLIAGGSGISPIFGILKYLLKHTAQYITLIDANRSASDIIYRQALNTLEQQYAPRLKIWHVLSRQGEISQDGEPRVILQRLNKLILKKILKQTMQERPSSGVYFMCGPAGLISLGVDTLVALAIPESKIRTEFFSPPETSKVFTPPEQAQEVLLHFGVQTNLLDVPGGQTILDAALMDRIPIRYSCRNGTCGTCAGKVISGKVIMQQNYALGADQLKEGFTLLCQAYPMDNAVTIEVPDINNE